MSTPELQTPKRGDIFWADLPEDESVGNEQKGRRVVLVFSSNKVNDALKQEGCVVVPLTRQVHKENRYFRIRILESYKIPEQGHSREVAGDSLALTEQIRFISRDRMDARRVASLNPLALAAVESGVKFVLGIP